MKILVDINHPAHVHFFRHLIQQAQAQKTDVVVVASLKDVSFKLLDELNIPYIRIGSYGKSFLSKVFNTLWLDFKMLLIVLKHKPDVMTGIGSVRICHVGFLLGKKTLVFDDTEDATFTRSLYLPFVTRVYTPTCFRLNLGKKQVRYPSYHEFAYLHPDRFTPNPSILEKFGVANVPFFIVRFSMWDALHDIGKTGMGIEEKLELINLLKQRGRVIISSETPLPDEIKDLEIKTNLRDMHHLLYYASAYIGEGGTMASEAAVLGTPSVFISTMNQGYLQELDEKYGLVKRFKDFRQACDFVAATNMGPEYKTALKPAHQQLLQDKIDTGRFMVREILGE